ncbi:MAG: hypothetical protein ACI9YH_002977 [Colwellia sp.]
MVLNSEQFGLHGLNTCVHFVRTFEARNVRIKSQKKIVYKYIF